MSATPSDRISGLNDRQAEAVIYGDGPLAVLAGAGTGKTRVLVHRIAELVHRGIPAPGILAVTFTNKAAGEMRERISHELGPQAQQIWIGTFHSMCARLLRRHGDRVGLSRSFSIYDDDDQLRILTALLKDNNLDDVMAPRSLRNIISAAKTRGEDPREQSLPFGADVVGTIYPLYQERLTREDAADFNDLLLKVVQLAEDPEFGPELSQRFRHVLVDEFQDTNAVQYRLVRHFVRNHQNLTVVGDDDQSIYSWRGAEPRNLLDFQRDYPDAEVIRLERNYRSTAPILRAANHVIAHNQERLGKELWTERDDGEPIVWEEAYNDKSEAEFIARVIATLQQDGMREYGDCAVLYRTHAQSRVLEEQLRRLSIPYRVVGGVSFFQRKEIKDIVAYMRLVVNPAADSCFERIVNTPARGIGKTTVDRVKGHAKTASISYLEACRSCGHGAVKIIGPAARKKLSSFSRMMDALGDLHASGATIADLLNETMTLSGYRQRLEMEDTQEARDRLDNLSELYTMALDFDEETEGCGTLIEFDERISLTSATDEKAGSGELVTLMTVHAAKGLEFPVVFIAGLEDGLFPNLRDWDELGERGVEEERRLAYVAMTRAMDTLILTSALARRQWGDTKLPQPSRFLDEIPADCLVVRRKRDQVQAPQSSFRSRSMRGSSYNEYDQRGYDDMPTINPDQPARALSGASIRVGTADFDVGSLVSHERFGTGRVVGSRGEGRDLKLLIDFSGEGLKTILARFVQAGTSL